MKDSDPRQPVMGLEGGPASETCPVGYGWGASHWIQTICQSNPPSWGAETHREAERAAASVQGGTRDGLKPMGNRIAQGRRCADQEPCSDFHEVCCAVVDMVTGLPYFPHEAFDRSP